MGVLVIGPIDVTAMADGLNDDPVARLVDPVDDPVVTSSSAVQSFELEPKGMADLSGWFGQGAVDELDGGEDHVLW